MGTERVVPGAERPRASEVAHQPAETPARLGGGLDWQRPETWVVSGERLHGLVLMNPELGQNDSPLHALGIAGTAEIRLCRSLVASYNINVMARTYKEFTDSAQDTLQALTEFNRAPAGSAEGVAAAIRLQESLHTSLGKADKAIELFTSVDRRTEEVYGVARSEQRDYDAGENRGFAVDQNNSTVALRLMHQSVGALEGLAASLELILSTTAESSNPIGFAQIPSVSGAGAHQRLWGELKREANECRRAMSETLYGCRIGAALCAQGLTVDPSTGTISPTYNIPPLIQSEERLRREIAAIPSMNIADLLFPDRSPRLPEPD